MNSKIFINSLGCPRNQVDSEIYFNIAAFHGYFLTGQPQDADLIFINTCGFIDSAKQESIDTILLNTQARKKGGKIIVTGCLVKRYENDLRKEMPEVDYFLELKDYHGFDSLLARINNDNLTDNPNQYIDYTRRKLFQKEVYAYLKIADGCENFCSYCAIPAIRGNVASDPLDKLVKEANFLAENGIKELIITAMDINQYGKDLHPHVNIVTLLDRLTAIDELKWIRLLYLHPKNISDELINFIKQNDKICPYLDIPIQHINDKILKSMNRGITRYETEQLIYKIRNKIPGIALRTSIIVGYPGETRKEFRELLDFVYKIKFNRLGVFTYSPEEGTPAYSYDKRVTLRTAQGRQEELMELQEAVSAKLLSKYIGKTLPVIVENIEECDTGEIYIEGRSRYDAPEIDGTVYTEDFKTTKGSIINVKITESCEHDLFGDVVTDNLRKP